MSQAPFDRRYIWVACIMAFGAGFAIAGHLSFVLGFGFRSGPGFTSFVQTHGHVQLIGWTGLLIMGISMHVMPRLAGVPLAYPHWRGWILWLITWGLGLRILGHSVMAYLPSPGFEVATGVVVLSGCLVLAGIGLYLELMRRTIAGAPGEQVRPALESIRPFMRSMLLGWTAYAVLNLLLVLSMAWRRQVALPPLWNDIAVRCFVGLVLLPVAFAFSVRFLPLYLRIPVSSWPIHHVAYVYFLGWGLQVLPLLPPVQLFAPQGSELLTHIGQMVKGIGILWFVWRLGALTQGARREKKASEYGFGPFAGLIVSAYIWLVVAAGGELLSSVGWLSGMWGSTRPDAIRHLYFMGFITLLIFGVGTRMLPGLLHARRVARPGLVSAMLWLGNAAVIGRVVLVGIPGPFWQGVPSGVIAGARIAFAWSGILGLVAVLCLALNLWLTAKMASIRAKSTPASAPE